MNKRELIELVYHYKTKYPEGFLPEELKALLKDFPDINMGKYNDAMRGNTCTMRENKLCIYHVDVYHALLCGLEDRDLTLEEWD